MSTAALERRAGQRMRGSGMHILANYTYFAYSAKVQISKEAYRSGKPPFEMHANQSDCCTATEYVHCRT
jgi:hypothetical protein